MGISNVLMKGGHLKENNLTDILINKDIIDYFYSCLLYTSDAADE